MLQPSGNNDGEAPRTTVAGNEIRCTMPFMRATHLQYVYMYICAVANLRRA